VTAQPREQRRGIFEEGSPMSSAPEAGRVRHCHDRGRARRAERGHHGGPGTPEHPVSGPPDWALSLLLDETDQLLRLSQFRRGHPGVVIRAGLGFWQAQIPQRDGELIITRYQLRELLDKLDVLAAGPEGS
jgi:hypothetical protein